VPVVGLLSAVCAGEVHRDDLGRRDADAAQEGLARVVVIYRVPAVHHSSVERQHVADGVVGEQTGVRERDPVAEAERTRDVVVEVAVVVDNFCAQQCDELTRLQVEALDEGQAVGEVRLSQLDEFRLSLAVEVVAPEGGAADLLGDLAESRLTRNPRSRLLSCGRR